MNIVQSLFQTGTEPQTPPHEGEAFALWALHVAIKEARVFCGTWASR